MGYNKKQLKMALQFCTTLLAIVVSSDDFSLIVNHHTVFHRFIDLVVQLHAMFDG